MYVLIDYVPSTIVGFVSALERERHDIMGLEF